MLALPKDAYGLLTTLEAAGYECRAVGGCVRDMLLGRVPGDYDLCTNATPGEMLALFGGRRLLTAGLKHGTVALLLGGKAYEITTYRADGAYTDHRRPESVRFVRTLDKDLSRRDFTVNAMAYRPGLSLFDPFDGRGDLSRRVIRCVGDPFARFEEDALRVLRALRFASRLNFAIEETTARAMLAKMALLNCLSAERVWGELTGLLAQRHVGRALPAFFPILETVLPGADKDAACALCQTPPDVVTRLALLLTRAGAEAAKAALARLKPDARTSRAVLALVGAADSPVEGDVSLTRLLRRLGAENARRLLDMRKAMEPEDAAKWIECRKTLDRLLADGVCYDLSHLSVNGGDLTRMGLSGPDVGRTLEALLTRVIEGELPNERNALLAALNLYARAVDTPGADFYNQEYPAKPGENIGG